MKTRLLFRMKAAFRRFTDYVASSETERMFRKEIEALLPPDFQVARATRYTESARTFEGEMRVPKHPTDYLIVHKGSVIAAIEVTTGSKGWSYEMSRRIPIDESKFQPMDQYNAGFLVMRVLVGEPHFIWVSREDIRSLKVENGKYWIDRDIWKQTLTGLAELLIKLAKAEDELRAD